MDSSEALRLWEEGCAQAVGEGEPLTLGPLAHFSDHCPQGLTPEGWATPMFFKSFFCD